jgi:hypothetical protein
MKLNNEKLELQQKIGMDKMKTQHNKEINELREKIDRLENQNKK